jgi:hypothetical protein
VMRRKPSIYLPEGLEYLICRNDVQSVLMSSIVLSLEEGRGWLELERALPLRRGPLVFETLFSARFTISHCTIPHANDMTRDYVHASW